MSSSLRAARAGGNATLTLGPLAVHGAGPYDASVPRSRALTDLQPRLQAALGDAYHVERELGGGGMSRLFLATEVSLHRQVVIKLLPPEFASEVSAARFKQEIELAAHLQHPNILPVLTAGAKEDLLFYVMPFVSGESLRHRLTREGKLPVADAVRILHDVADALAYAHAEGVIHRDIKPENILLLGSHAVLMDFGVARALTEARSGGRLTDTGLALGTPGYMSPEQAAGERHIDARADVYALAVVGYEMLAGVPPFAGPTAQAVIAAHLTATPKPLLDSRPETPPEVAIAIEQALARDPNARLRTAAEFRDALEGAVARSAPWSRRARYALAVVAGLVLIGALVFWRLEVLRGRSAAGPMPNGTAGAKTIAVLPFENVGGDPKEEYFADGITNELTSALGRVGGLRVAARSSAFAFKGKNPDVREVGAKLRVATLLEGTVQRAGTRLRLTAQLVNAADGLSLWSETYERQLTDVFRVQEDVARAIVGALPS